MAHSDAGLKVALIGFGEVGSSLGTGLKSQGVEQVVAYDKGFQTPPFGELIQRRSKEIGVPLAPTVAEAVLGVDLVLAMVPGSFALDAATEAATVLKPGQIYADMGTASPPVKEKMAAVVEATGASFVDVAIMGSPLQEQHHVATLASGKDAERYRALVTPFGMKAKVVGERPGKAAAIKMFRSIFMKGIEALTIETLLAAETWGVADVVMESVSHSLGQEPFHPGQTDFFATTDAIHGGRRAHEMDMVIQTMEDVGVEPRMTRATAAFIHWTASLGLREHFGGVVPSSWKLVTDEIARRTASN